MNISCWISHWANWAPDRAALRFEGRSTTYAELERRVAGLAGFLAKSGLTPGDRVAYLGPNCPELLETLFAAARIGAIFAPLNARMPPPELRVFVEQSEPRLLVAEESFRDAAVTSAPELTPNDVVLFDANGLEPHVRDETPVAADPELDGATPVLIAYTSGTSGTPKGAVLTHEALTTNALNSIAAFEMTADDEILTAAPMFHVGGLNIHTTPALRAGATVTVHRQFDPALALEEIRPGGRARPRRARRPPALAVRAPQAGQDHEPARAHVRRGAPAHEGDRSLSRRDLGAIADLGRARAIEPRLARVVMTPRTVAEIERLRHHREHSPSTDAKEVVAA